MKAKRIKIESNRAAGELLKISGIKQVINKELY